MRHRLPARLLAGAGFSVAAIAGLAGSGAQDLTLAITIDVFTDASADTSADEPAHSVRTEVTASYGHATSVSVGVAGTKTLVVDITPEPADDESYNVWVAFREVDGESSELIASPVLQARFGESTGVAFGDEEIGYQIELRGEKPDEA